MKKGMESSERSYKIVGYEYQKAPRFNTIYCGECIKHEPLDWDWIMDITAAEAEEDETVCDICGKRLKGAED